MVDGADATSIKEIHRIPVAINRQMVDDPDATSIEDLHRNPVATIARWWTIQMRRRSKISTAWPRWLPGVGANRTKKSRRSHQSPDGGRSRCDANRRIPPRGAIAI